MTSPERAKDYASLGLGRMRIIAGKFRSRRLRSVRGVEIRPTSDRLRETLFNVLTAGNPAALEGTVWLDLFAGSGAVGIEALSRGAMQVYFVESSRDAAELIRQNLRSLAITTGFQLVQQGSTRAVSYLQKQGIEPDFIFLDLPYEMREALSALSLSSLSERALIIVEHEKRFDPGEKFGRVERVRQLKQGDAGLSFYRCGPVYVGAQRRNGRRVSQTG